MENKQQDSNKDAAVVNSAHELIEEWKRRKLEDEKEFLQEINDPEHQRKMEAIRGKIVKNEAAAQ